MSRRSCHEHGVHAAGMEINLRHLQFIVKVCNRSKTLDYDRHVILLAKIDRQSIPRINNDIRESLSVFADHFHPLLNAKETVFASIFEDGHYYAIKVIAGSFDDIKVSVGDRIEGSRTHGALHAVNASNDCQSYPFSPSCNLTASQFGVINERLPILSRPQRLISLGPLKCS